MVRLDIQIEPWMGDPFSSYWHVLSGLSHFLPVSECICWCEGEMQTSDTCPRVTKAVVRLKTNPDALLNLNEPPSFVKTKKIALFQS